MSSYSIFESVIKSSQNVQKLFSMSFLLSTVKKFYSNSVDMVKNLPKLALIEILLSSDSDAAKSFLNSLIISSSESELVDDELVEGARSNF